ncbi:hypothetical protein [Sphingosinicella sp. BN140058]|uniref:hypothetical protein n=1 Tax=Sphingosinicella sp. BN140058 TaxID=1892855 RepID=UPI0010138033|nr:hypothetical protein [Sphingosinicella sp. BN140058]QAY80175.1 hypothetical protein ETR14_26390 [Sphingosinicella sp. BN140058]
MILTLITTVAIATLTQAPADRYAATSKRSEIQFAGMFGGKRKFVEIVQEPQIETDVAPTVGRRPERAPEPFVPVRYLTPEQRAEPIIVDPAPVLIYANAQKDSGPEQASESDAQFGSNYPATAADSGYQQPAPNNAAPSYITSTPPPAAPDVPLTPAGSATGSKAVANYGTPQ